MAEPTHTPNKNWEWYAFERGLFLAANTAELKAAQKAFTAAFRAEVKEQWIKDGRYEWLQSKTKMLKKARSEQVVFWSRQIREVENSDPREGTILRGGGHLNKPMELISRELDDGGNVFFNLKCCDSGDELTLTAETCDYWPIKGKDVSFSIRLYLDWLVAQRDIQVKNEKALGAIEARLESFGALDGHVGGKVESLMRFYPLVDTKGSLGVVQMGEERLIAPLSTLYVK